MDPDRIVSIALLIAILAVELWCILRLTAGPGVDIEDLLGRQDDASWPRGVQEEDLVAWRVERLTPTYGRSPAASETAADRRLSEPRTTAGPSRHLPSVSGRH